MKLFDPIKGIISAVSTSRDVSSALVQAEEYIRKIKSSQFIEDLIKDVQKLYPLTNDEVYGLILKVDAELKPKEEVIAEPIIKE